MLDLKAIRQDPDAYRRDLERRGDAAPLERLLELDAARRRAIARLEALRAQRNRVSQEISRLKALGQDTQALIASTRADGEEMKRLDEEVRRAEEGVEALLRALPNRLHPLVPDGGELDAQECRRRGEPASFPFPPRPHWDIGVQAGLVDLERAGKVSGARFAFFRGQGAQLVRALIQWMVDVHVAQHGYEELLPPYLVNADSAFGTGQLPKFAQDMFMTTDGRYLIPTAEIPVTNFHRDEILDGERLPIKYVAYSACFRSEAGASGRDTRGVIRQHQFDKVELVRFTRPEESEQALEELVGDAEDMLARLGLPYRVVRLASRDTSFASCMTYDLEVHLPSSDGYREISSCSNFGDFQARRAGIRYRPQPGAHAEFVHTLNGSGLAVGRTWAAIVENFQTERGQVRVPEVLRPYMGGAEVIGTPSS